MALSPATLKNDNAAARSRRRGVRRDQGVDGRLPTPLYHQIYMILRNAIVNGGYPDGAMLPSESELTKLYGVSRITAKRALNELAADGLAERARGRGTQVRHSGAGAPITSSVEGLLENLLEMGLKTTVRLLDFGYMPADPDAARALGIEPGAVAQRAVRVRRLDDGPMSHLTTWVPEDVGRSYSRDDLAAKPLLSLLERSGVIVTSASQTVSATLADAQIAPLLDVDVGGPLLRIARIVSDQTGRPVEYITGLYRPDRYQVQMMLNRVEGEDRRKWAPAG